MDRTGARFPKRLVTGGLSSDPIGQPYFCEAKG